MTTHIHTFDRHRSHLFGIAYRMLGSVMDAEDMVQETFLRWQTVRETAVKSPKAFLTSIVTRLSIDQLRSARMQRESYIGPWLPEPLLQTEAEEGAERMLILSESLSLAFMLLLEKLTPTERAVFLLRQVFDYDYSEIATLVDKSEGNCRQIFRRAKQRIDSQRPRFEPKAETHEQLLMAFYGACFTGDLDGLLALLADDVVATSDGGGKARAARRPVLGAENVARFMMGLTRLAPDGFAIRLQQVNEALGVVGYSHGQPMMVVVPEIRNGRIYAIRSILNPDKLQNIPPLA
ncbi:MAG: RNA polymerase sigma-70 factor [Chloroflexota bacterium]